MILGKVPPQDIEIESAVLSSLLQEKNSIYEVMNVLDASCFYKEEHQKIYQAILDLCHENKGIDLLTVTNKLRTQSLLEEVGGPLFVTQLSSKVSSTYNLKTHGEILKELAIKRGLITISHNIEEMAYDEEQDAPAVMGKIESDLYALNAFNSKKAVVSISTTVAEALENMEKWNSHKLTGIPTGFTKLDSITGGFQPSDYILLGGRPSMGKTLIAAHFIVTAATFEYPVAFFSLEMNRVAISTRMICAKTGLGFDDIRAGLTDAQWGGVEVAASHLEKLPVYLDDTANIPVLELVSKARRLAMQREIKLIVIDYLQLITPDIKYSKTSKDERVGEVNKALKGLAKELNIPVICLSQLNRATELHGDKRPGLSNLRDSGSSEADADLVMLVHRGEFYKDPDVEHNVGELIIAKHRNGRLDTVKFRHPENLSKVYDY